MTLKNYSQNRIIRRSTKSYHHHDGLGSVILLTNTSGAILERYRYDVFGYVTILDAAHATRPATAHNNRFLYTGREWLAALQLYDYRNRTYSPNLGRFLQTDPIRFRAGDINLYRYVRNNPAWFIDPLGLKLCKGNVVVGHGNPYGTKAKNSINNYNDKFGNQNNCYVGCGADTLNKGGLGDSISDTNRNNREKNRNNRSDVDIGPDPDNKKDIASARELDANVQLAIDAALNSLCSRDCCKEAEVTVICLPGGEYPVSGFTDKCRSTHTKNCE